MTMITIVCPKCGGVARLSLVDTGYVGPRRCWKCHEYFTITIENNRVTSCEPLSQEEYERQQEAKKAAEKARSGINFSRQGESEVRQFTPEKPQGNSQSGISYSKREEPEIRQLALNIPQEDKKAPAKTQSGISISSQEKDEIHKVVPAKQGDFIKPLMAKVPPNQAEPGKPAAPFPPDRFQTFVPLEDIHEGSGKTQKFKKTSPEKRVDYTGHKVPPNQAEPGKPAATFPPDRFQTFVPLEDIQEETERPKKPKNPSERFNTFIPPAT
jgi:hypothetical protein